jgi:hypothetical protein
MAVLLAVLLGCFLPTSPAWSQTAPGLVQGVVRTTDQLPLEGVNVFVLETLEGAVTDSAGRFSIATTDRTAATLVARRLGYGERRIALQLPQVGALQILLAEEAVAPSGVRPARKQG